MNKSVLIVDDDEVMRKLIREVLEKDGFKGFIAGSGEDALRFFDKKPTPIVVSDIRMLETDGLTLLKEIKKREPKTVVILMTGFGSMQGAIEAVQLGAFDYISKPFQMRDLQNLVQRAFKHYETLTSVTKDQTVSQHETLIGRSAKIIEVYKKLARAALSQSNVLITGEKGTGKKLVAKSIHENSPRKAKPFLSVEAPTLHDGFLKPEFFKSAQDGTLYIESVSELSPSLQQQLVEAIDSGLFAKIRLIAGNAIPLEEPVRDGKFREDLYFRLNVISIDIPPLRERIEDLPDLVDRFIAKHSSKNGKSVSHISDEAMQALKSYPWPGNVRELEFVIERAIALTSGAILFPEDLKLELKRREAQNQTKESLESLEKIHILKVLQDSGFNKSKASEILGIDRATLYRKAQKYGIDLKGKGSGG